MDVVVKKEEPRVFSIDRSLWANGSSGIEESSLLLNCHLHMCCMGFDLKSCGATDATLSQLGMPRSVELGALKKLTVFPDHLVRLDLEAKMHTRLAITLAELNDSKFPTDYKGRLSITRVEREQMIIDAYAKHAGIKVEFVGEYVNPEPERVPRLRGVFTDDAD
jgi:hypothetical protein